MAGKKVASDSATLFGAEPSGQAEKPDNSLGLKAPPLTVVPPTNNTTAMNGMQRGIYSFTRIILPLRSLLQRLVCLYSHILSHRWT